MPFLSLRCKVYLINSLINVSAPVPLHVPLSHLSVLVRVPMRVPMRMFLCAGVCVCVRGVWVSASALFWHFWRAAPVNNGPLFYASTEAGNVVEFPLPLLHLLPFFPVLFRGCLRLVAHQKQWRNVSGGREGVQGTETMAGSYRVPILDVDPVRLGMTRRLSRFASACPEKIQWRFMCPLQLRFLLCGPAASAAAAAFSSITGGVCWAESGGVGAVGQLVSNSISWLLHALCAIYATHFRARHERAKKPFTQYNKPKT